MKINSKTYAKLIFLAKNKAKIKELCESGAPFSEAVKFVGKDQNIKFDKSFYALWKKLEQRWN